MAKSKKTKADLEKEILNLKSEMQKHYHSISNNNFQMKTEIIWDKATVQVMDKVAQGLLNMTSVFNKQKVELPSLLSIKDTKDIVINGCIFNTGEQEDSDAALKFK